MSAEATPDPSAESAGAMERNLVLYGRHQVAARLLFAFPTAMLFLLERVELDIALRLTAVYFAAVVVLEVPSGWASDRFGRVPTLRIGATAWVASNIVFLIAGSSVAALAAAQILVALGWACLSGTDSSFHFDTLEALGRSDEFERREATASRNAFLATMAASLIGGALGLIDLRLPYVALLCAALMQWAIAWSMTEPAAAAPVSPAGEHLAESAGFEAARRESAIAEFASTVRQLRRPELAWVFVFMTVQQPLEGLAFDLMPPWITELTDRPLDDAGSAPLLVGLLVAVISLVGAATAARAAQLRARLGTRGALTLLAAIETCIVVGMALVVSPWLLPLIALRSTQAAAGPVIVAAASAPLLERHQRATYLSLGSFSGRLAVAASLVVISAADSFDDVLTVAAWISLGCLATLIAATPLLRR